LRFLGGAGFLDAGAKNMIISGKNGNHPSLKTRLPLNWLPGGENWVAFKE